VSLSGRVVLAGGQAAPAGTTVEVRRLGSAPDDAAAWDYSGLGDLAGWTQGGARVAVGTDGRYTVPGLTAGQRYGLLARAPGYAPTWLGGQTGQDLAPADAGAAVTTLPAGLATVGVADIVLRQTVVAPTLTLSRTATWVAPAAGGSVTATATTNQPLWTVSASADWVALNPSSGTSGKSFTATVQGNPTGAARSATVTAAAGGLVKSFAVSQGAGTLTASAASYAAPVTGGTLTVSASTTAPGGWQASSNQPWVVVERPSAASGSSFTLHVASNPTTAARTAQVTVAAGTMTRTVAVTQAGTAWLRCAATTVYAGYTAATLRLPVGTNQASWTATVPAAAQSWLSLAPGSGTGGQTLGLAVTANTGGLRSAVVTVRAGSLAQSVVVYQAGNGYVALSSGQWLPGAGGGQAAVAVTSRATWTATSTATSWLTVTPASGATGGFVTLTAAPNPTGQPRTALVNVISGGQYASVIVTQSP
jgi:hypothetical protein